MQKLLLIAALLFLYPEAHASDTLRLDLSHAEERFIRKNFFLLASEFNVNIAEALEKQVALWNNPVLSLEQNMYNQYTHKTFDMTNTGQSAAQVQQLFLLAGKRNKRLAVQKLSSQITQYQFFDLMRTLRLEMVTHFYHLYFTSQKRQSLDKQIAPLQLLTDAYQKQLLKGNVSLKEVARLKALLFKLETEKLNLLSDEYSYHAMLKNMLAIRGDTVVTVLHTDTKGGWLGQKKVEDLKTDAQVHRFDLLASQADIALQEANIRLQKAQAVPDLNLGMLYDRAGSYIQNYYAVTLNVALPVFNRNQQMIEMAKLQRQQSELQQQGLLVNLNNEINKQYVITLQLDDAYKSLSGNLFYDIEQLQKAIIENYQKKNITLIEFVDFYESYKENINNYLDLKLNRETAFEELYFTLGHKLND